VRADVGDRYVLEKLKQNNWKIGGENSGHIISLDHNTTGDGVVAALLILTAVLKSGLSLQELRQGMTLMPQKLINVGFKGESDPLRNIAVLDAVAKAESQLGERGRVLLRKSGTEPLIRVMVEGEDDSEVTMLAQAISDVVTTACN